MSQKNYFVRENVTEQQYFCQLQVSEKFRRTMDAQEAELLVWLVEKLVHRSTTQDQADEIARRLQLRIEDLNASRSMGPYLVVSYQPLRTDESGFIRIERTAGRHQSVLLPIIDYRGGVRIENQ
ncbi:MAG: hypothetical protein II886_13620 [Prevotella sp.]|nr:hypothetical protein [Prevotella sp.]